nr:reverse transcriptase domain protein [Colletotrichum truncatum]KAF6788702.1 reverse transcriptase domain protein [Colletotrichum truncatum]
MNSTTETAKYTQRLQTDSDWNHWFNNLQMLANVHEVWDYVNPKGTKINTKPRLEFPDPKDLRQEERANYSNVISYRKAIYQEEKDQYNQVRRSLLEIHSWIMNTVAATYISQVSKEQTVRDIIKALEKQLAPDNFGRQQIVLERYNKHMLSIKRAKLGGWLIIYREIMDEAQTIGIPALSDPVTQVSEFLKAVKQIAPDYYTSASYDFTKRYKDDPTYSSISKTAGIEQANDFRSWRIILLKWVFTYKGSKGYLKKFKARICVRGDLQPTNELETYASTLAGISLRSLMAIVARFDLETLQLDAVNAFTHATIDEEVYVWFPPGFRQEGYCLALRKALYGLRRSPLLWQKNLERSFKKLGLIPLQEDDCIYTNQYFIVFHFVDDIGLIYHKKHETKVKEAVQQLKKEYEMKDMGELSIFLGVRIIRERKTRQLWMSLDNYISKVTEEFKIRTSTKRRQTPMAIDNLVLSPGQATPEEINYYQRKVGSINYAGVIGRPDIARTSSRLAEFLSNPSSEHQKAAYECLQYLEDNKYLAIEFNCKGKGVLYCASDASFADDSVTRKSTQGYVMMLFGGPIHWKAVKQRRVVTSSTEAELAALTAATREYMATIRLMEQLNLQLDDKYIMQCDNKQTLRLLIAERPQATSKLRHININNLWLRQELQKGSIDFQWVPTNEMVADGMTKAMPAQKHNHFIAQLGMANIEHLIEKNAV